MFYTLVKNSDDKDCNLHERILPWGEKKYQFNNKKKGL